MALTILPNPGQTLNATRNPIRQNFTDIDTAFSVDHVDYALADQGKHKKITFVTQPNNPLPPLAANQFAMYNAIPNTGANAAYPVTLTSNEIIIERLGNPFVVPMTAAIKGVEGWTYFPSGVLAKWGSYDVSGTTPQPSQITVVYPTSPNPAPVFTVVFKVFLTILSDDGSGANTSSNVYAVVRNFSNPLQFTAYIRKITGTSDFVQNFKVQYLAIGA